MTSMIEIKKYLETHRERFLAELSDFLSIPSISTAPESQTDCVRCAKWLLDHVQTLGLRGELRYLETGYPVLVARSGAPTSSSGRAVTFYGHYDVQPCDSLELWQTPPFAPAIRNGRLYARGAQDNKGQLWYVIKALEFLKSAGLLEKLNIALCIEGQEECGSEVLAEKITKLSPQLKAETLLVCDTGTRAAEVATITMGLRGIAHCTVTVRGPSKDLHSGVHGGVARNPAQELARLLAGLFDENGRVTVQGFYDGVVEPSTEDATLAASGMPSQAEYEALIGGHALGGERGYSIAERAGFRPTLECNGIHSGYGGSGSKTIIPSIALAKLSMRLVQGQGGAKILAAIKRHLTEHAVGVTVEITEERVGGPALQVSPQSDCIKRVVPGLRELMGADPLYLWLGASIPIISELAHAIGAEPLLVGFGLEDDNIHAPNESFAIEQFDRGFVFACQALIALTAK